MTEENQKPDRHTLAWWQNQLAELKHAYRGATHAVNRSIADYKDCHETIKELRQRCDEFQAEAETDRAKIGELQAELVQATERLDRMAEFLTVLKEERNASD